MSPRPEQHIVTFKCEGCGTRSPAPAPYGGYQHTACSDACLMLAKHLLTEQRKARRAAFIARLLEGSHVPTP